MPILEWKPEETDVLFLFEDMYELLEELSCDRSSYYCFLIFWGERAKTSTFPKFPLCLFDILLEVTRLLCLWF